MNLLENLSDINDKPIRTIIYGQLDIKLGQITEE